MAAPSFRPRPHIVAPNPRSLATQELSAPPPSPLIAMPLELRRRKMSGATCSTVTMDEELEVVEVVVVAEGKSMERGA